MAHTHDTNQIKIQANYRMYSMKHRTKMRGTARRKRQGRQNKNWPMYYSK